jgi:hypothetical protein
LPKILLQHLEASKAAEKALPTVSKAKPVSPIKKSLLRSTLPPWDPSKKLWFPDVSTLDQILLHSNGKFPRLTASIPSSFRNVEDYQVFIVEISNSFDRMLG